MSSRSRPILQTVVRKHACTPERWTTLRSVWTARPRMQTCSTACVVVIADNAHVLGHNDARVLKHL
eukprot:4134536-Alexandrium_andersonii.AAC.1